jgi:hypothetical protein
MAPNISKFQKIFHGLQNCQMQILKIFPNTEDRDKDLPIQRLHESFALCSGAFYFLNLYQKNYGNLFLSSKNVLPHSESWKLFSKVRDLNYFNETTKLPSQLIKTELRSMCIANAAFRLPSAGFLVSSVIREIKKNSSDQIVLNNLHNLWRYESFLRINDKDWNRQDLGIKDDSPCDFGDNPDTPAFRIALLICMRDEYGHSEYHKDFQCRQKIIAKYYRKKIVRVETKFLLDTIYAINKLCQYHNQKKIDLFKKY